MPVTYAMLHCAGLGDMYSQGLIGADSSTRDRKRFAAFPGSGLTARKDRTQRTRCPRAIAGTFGAADRPAPRIRKSSHAARRQLGITRRPRGLRRRSRCWPRCRNEGRPRPILYSAPRRLGVSARHDDRRAAVAKPNLLLDFNLTLPYLGRYRRGRLAWSMARRS